MGFAPKSYEEVMKDMIAQITKDIEIDMFGGPPKHERGMRNVLSKLGIKTANYNSSTFMIESLEATLKISNL